MSMSKYNRNANPKRELRDRVLILCGGQTELAYFKHLAIFLKNKKSAPLRNVKIDFELDNRDQLNVVKSAISKAKGFNEIWVVFDEDAGHGLDEAVKLAKDNNINCAYSHKAFEFWLLLHLYQDFSSMSAEELNKKLSKYLGFEYRKTKEFKKVFDKTINNILDAEDWAKARHQHLINEKDIFGDKPSGWNPCTTVYQLTKQLRLWGESQ